MTCERQTLQVEDRPQHTTSFAAPEVHVMEAPAETALTTVHADPSSTVEIVVGDKVLKIKTNAPVVLTRRERRVKGILLKELTRFSRGKLDYADRRYLEENLTVDYIDKHIGYLRKTLRWWRPFNAVVAMVATALIVGHIIKGWQNPDLPLLMNVATPLLLLITTPMMTRAHRRRLFIFEALRELTNADEADVLLDNATRDADALIQRIVERELETDARYSLLPFKREGG